MAHETITVTIKALSGDLIQIAHQVARGYWWFKHEVYNALPDIPHGCLHLRLLHREDPVDEVGWLMRLADIDASDDEEPGEVYDGDVFGAFVDDRHLHSWISLDADAIIKSPIRKRFYITLRHFFVHFADSSGEVVSLAEIFQNVEEDRFCLRDSITPPYPVEFSSSRGQIAVWKVNDDAVWFPSLREALLAAPCIPKSNFQLDEVILAFQDNDWLYDSFHPSNFEDD